MSKNSGELLKFSGELQNNFPIIDLNLWSQCRTICEITKKVEGKSIPIIQFYADVTDRRRHESEYKVLHKKTNT